ncbi:hydroxyisourate hydrolase [soil metagenome]
MSKITTHVLDTSLGRPAAGVDVVLEYKGPDDWEEIGRGTTNSDGRFSELVPADWVNKAGTYQLTFNTGGYFEATRRQNFYPTVPIIFEIVGPEEHHHVPLLLSPFGYSTYRGS